MDFNLAVCITPGIKHILYSVAQAELAGVIFESGPNSCFHLPSGAVLPLERHGRSHIFVVHARGGGATAHSHTAVAATLTKSNTHIDTTTPTATPDAFTDEAT